MPVTNSARRGLKLLGGTPSDKRSVDLKAIRDTFIQIDIELDRLRKNSIETITHIHGGKANGGGFVKSTGYGIDADAPVIIPPDIPSDSEWILGQTNFAFTGVTYTPTTNFTF